MRNPKTSYADMLRYLENLSEIPTYEEIKKHPELQDKHVQAHDAETALQWADNIIHGARNLTGYSYFKPRRRKP